ncbi:hypothetical protein K7711_45370 [Nocardia sp. CA2R105]|uniref:DUF7065 domain-containing protein n=1 Tax=Nocardia coffeae TaxID=2873381 RepID=UPI001CA778A0|nr:hypothetical protein [Nocardia coffeae]MBY8863762.1 hypothetical protein [Nocardia coffeae]
MSDRKLTPVDDYLHQVGTQQNWNESRYIDFHDPATGTGGWFRIGMRPNEGHAEMSVSINLPDGRHAFFFERAPIEGNRLIAGGQEWTIGDPYRSCTVSYSGPVLILEDAWVLADPKKAFTTSPREHAEISLEVRTEGLEAVMGSDQEDIDKIFLPGQADWHYQHLCWVKGTVTVGDQTFEVDGRGGKDHSWGPRNWLAKIYLRWLIGTTDDDELGFMLVRGVGPTKRTRSGHVWEKGQFFLVDDFDMKNTYSDTSPYELLRCDLAIRSGDREWTVTGTPEAWEPLRHRAKDENGDPAILRIVKSPTRWTFGDGRLGAGMCEIHDRLSASGVPAGIED